MQEQSLPPQDAPASSIRQLLASIRRRPWKSALLFGLALILLDILLLPIPTLVSYRAERPDVTAFQQSYLEGSGTAAKRRALRKQWTPLKQVGQTVIKAVLVSEDASFYDHHGFDWYEVQETIERSLSRGKVVRGASTITQQLVKNLFLSPSRNPVRKWHEVLLTIVAEISLPKRRILELYLNEIEWGDGVYGIGAAARTYFDKEARDLTPHEAALLAAVIPNPRVYSVRRPSAYVLKRQRRILRLMNVRDPVEEALTIERENGVDSLSNDVDTLGRSPDSPALEMSPTDTLSTNDSTNQTGNDDIQRH